jgi:hypothetical protein
MVLFLGLFLTAAPALFSAEPMVPGEFFVSTVVGHVTCISDGRVLEIKHGDTIAARGSAIDTDEGAHCIVVFSNGTAVYVDENTHFDVEKFEQEFFAPTNNLRLEPSNSQMLIGLATGRLVIATPELRGGTSMVFETPEASITVHGGQLVIWAGEDGTHVAVISGSTTVNPRDDRGDFVAVGRRLTAGQQAFVPARRPGVPSSSYPLIVSPFDVTRFAQIVAELAAARAAQASVQFSIETADDHGGLFGIAAQPTVPPVLPIDFVVSPAIGQ